MTAGIRVGCANGSIVRAVATEKLSLEALLDRARDCHKFIDITLPLISVPQLCDSNMEVLFNKISVAVTNANGDTVLEGHRDPSRNLYMVPLEDSPPPPRVVSPMIDDPTVPWRHTTANAYEIQAVPALIAFLHTAFPQRKPGYVRWMPIFIALGQGYPHHECDATLPNLNQQHSVI